jgi:DNA-binding FadR family transcriptional regulator
MELKRLKTQNLQDQIREQLKLYIIGKGLKSGDPLPTEKELADGLGASRTVVRECLKSMESLGIIEVRPGIGRFIREFNFEAILNNLPYSLETDVRSFKDVLEIRVGLETYFLLRDLRLFSPADIADLEGLIDELSRLVEADSAEADLISLHTEFHCALYRRSDNPLLIKLIKIFATIQRNLTLLNQYRSANRPLFVRQHRSIVESIRTADPEMVRRVMMEHFQEPMSWVEKHVGLNTSPEKKN